MDMDTRRLAMLETFRYDRHLAHSYLFRHRHKETSPEFHREIIELFNSTSLRPVALMAFRGGAKSTLIEEDIILKALFNDVEFILIVGNSWSSACERLATIKQEFETNDLIIELFGDQKSAPWAADELVLANGVKIQAIGARQSMRGMKHGSARPDYAVLDDLEDEDNIATPEARRKTERWMVGTLRPAMNPKTGRIRFIGTALHPEALIQKKCDDREWDSRKFPIMYLDESGVEVSAWEDRFPLAAIQKLRNEYITNGNLIEFEQEYMCRAEDMSGKPFQLSMIRVEALPNMYMPVEIVVDPARTTKITSARTGYVVYSWFGSKLYVHEAFGAFHKPDEIVDTIFALSKKYDPVFVGVEANSLDEFIMQPIRDRVLATGVSIPVEALYAPKDKENFIKGLQPFYMSGNVIHAKHLPDLESELLQFPTGRRDVPNALAYALRLRRRKPIYEDFTVEHISPVLELRRSAPQWLVVSARPSVCAAALVQYINGVLRIKYDWVMEGPPQEKLYELYRQAIQVAEGGVKLGSPAEQFDKYNNNGIAAAAKRLNLPVIKLCTAQQSEGVLKNLLTQRMQGDPALIVSDQARWTIKGLARGYGRKVDTDGTLSNLTEENHYKVLIEAIETFMMWIEKSEHANNDSSERRYASTRDGRRYLTSLPR